MGKNVGKKVSRTAAGRPAKKLRMVGAGAAKTATRAKKPARSGRSSGQPRVLGVTHDGIEILEPPFGPTHFTKKELRDVVRAVRAAR